MSGSATRILWSQSQVCQSILRSKTQIFGMLAGSRSGCLGERLRHHIATAQGYATALPWKCPSNAMMHGIGNAISIAIAIAMPWHCHSNALPLLLPWRCHGIAMALQWQCRGNAMAHCHDIAMALRWQCHGITMAMHKNWQLPLTNGGPYTWWLPRNTSLQSLPSLLH